MLRDNIAFLVGLVELDHRGGIFAQNDKCTAFAKAAQEHDKLEIMYATKTACMMTPEEIISRESCVFPHETGVGQLCQP